MAGRRVQRACLLVLALSCAASRSLAASVDLADAVSVEGQGCIERDSLVSALRTSLGGATLDARVRVVVRNEEPRGASFSIVRDGRSLGERRLGGGMECAQLRSALGLAIAVAIDATLVEMSDLARTAEVPRPPVPAPSAPPLQPVARELPRQASPPWARFSVGAAGLLWLDLLPVPVVGGELWAAYRPSRGLALRGTFLATDAGSVPLGLSGTRVHLLAGRLEPCWVWDAGVLEGHACAGVGAGAVEADGYGLPTNLSVAKAWAAAAASADAQVPVASWLRLALNVEGFVPFVSPRFDVVTPLGAAVATHRTPPAGVGVGAGIVFAPF